MLGLYWLDPSCTTSRGFVDIASAFTTIGIPGAIYTEAYGINDA
jgi:hypothetical protein